MYDLDVSITIQSLFFLRRSLFHLCDVMWLLVQVFSWIQIAAHTCSRYSVTNMDDWGKTYIKNCLNTIYMCLCINLPDYVT